MVKKSYRIFSLLLVAIVLVVSNISVLAQDNVSISRFEMITPDKDQFLSGESVVIYTGLTVSEEGGNLTDTVLEFRFPKEYIESVNAPDFETQTGKSVDIDGEEYVVRYRLGVIAAGVSLDFPFSVKTLDGKTPDGYKLPVVATLLDGFDNEVVPEIQKDVSIKTNKISHINKTAQCQMLKDNQIVEQSSGQDGTICFGGAVDDNDTSRLTTDVSRLKPIKYSISLPLKNGNVNYGNREIKTILVEDKLPEGALFVQEDNPGWNYNEETRTVSREIDFSSNRHNNLPYGQRGGQNPVMSLAATLTLYYPGAKTMEDIKNTIQTTFIPEGETEYEKENRQVLVDDIIIKLDEVKEVDPYLFDFKVSKGQYSTVYDVEIVKEKENLQYTIAVSNTSRKSEYTNYGLENIVITDNKLDENLRFKELVIPRHDKHDSGFPYGLNGTVNVYEIDRGGNDILIAENLDVTSEKRIVFSDDITGFKVVTTAGSYVQPGKQLNLQPIAVFKDPSKEILSSTETQKKLRNDVSATASYVGVSRELSDTAYAETTIIKVDKPQAGLTKTIQDPKTEYNLNDTVDYTLTIGVTNFNKEVGQRVVFGKLIDLLPKGVDYVANSAQLKKSNSNSIELPYENGTFEPTVIRNYKGTGQTALVWDLFEPEISLKISKSFYLTTIFTIEYQTILTRTAEEGYAKNEAYMEIVNADNVTITGSRRKDTFDINDNSDSEEYVAYGSASIRYIPSFELITNLEVIGNLDDNYKMDPDRANGEIYSPAKYHLNVLNNSKRDYSFMTVLNILPHVGDKTVSLDKTQIPNVQKARNSEFEIRLSGPLEVPNGYTVYYTEDIPVDDSIKYTNEANWVTEVNDYSKIRAYKIVMNEGLELKSKESVDFYAPFTVPHDVELEQLSKITNSFGTSTVRSLVFGESNFATLQVHKYSVEGHVFEDINKDGLFDIDDEPVFKAHTVQLVDADGYPVLDLDGNVYTTVTDDQGYYSFNVYRQGEYKVKVVNPEDYTLTTLNSNVKGSHILANSLTDVFILNRSSNHAIKNAGYYQDKATVTILKDVMNKDNEQIHNDEVFSFDIMIKDKLYSGPARIITNETSHSEVINIENGRVQLTSKQAVMIENLIVGTGIEVSEIENTKYQPESKIIKGVVSTEGIKIRFVNHLVAQKTEISVNKVWIGGPQEKPTIQVQLYRNGEAYLDAVTLVNGVTEYTWNELDKTDINGVEYIYTVDEVEVPENYVKVVDGMTISNTYESPKTEITVNKEWVGGPDVKPTIQVQLYRNNEAYGDAITLENGVTTYTWRNLEKTDANSIEYIYTVDEVKIPENYKKEVKGHTITNRFIEIPEEPNEPDNPKPPVEPEEPGLPGTGVGNDSIQLSFLMIALGSIMLVISNRKRKKA